MSCRRRFATRRLLRIPLPLARSTSDSRIDPSLLRVEPARSECRGGRCEQESAPLSIEAIADSRFTSIVSMSRSASTTVRYTPVACPSMIEIGVDGLSILAISLPLHAESRLLLRCSNAGAVDKPVQRRCRGSETTTSNLQQSEGDKSKANSSVSIERGATIGYNSGADGFTVKPNC